MSGLNEEINDSPTSARKGIGRGRGLPLEIKKKKITTDSKIIGLTSTPAINQLLTPFSPPPPTPTGLKQPISVLTTTTASDSDANSIWKFFNADQERIFPDLRQFPIEILQHDAKGYLHFRFEFNKLDYLEMKDEMLSYYNKEENLKKNSLKFREVEVDMNVMFFAKLWTQVKTNIEADKFEIHDEVKKIPIRGQVLSKNVDKKEIKVEAIDEAILLNVKDKELFILDKRFLQFPSQRIRCKMEGMQFLLGNITLHKIRQKILEETKHSNRAGVVTMAIHTTDPTTTIIENTKTCFIFEKHEQMEFFSYSSLNEKYYQVLIKMLTPKFPLEGEILKIKFVQVQTNGIFHFQLDNIHVAHFLEKIRTICLDGKLSMSKYELRKNTLYLVKLNKGVFRGRIIQIVPEQDHLLQVELVDYGRLEEVSSDKIYDLKNCQFHLAKIPYLYLSAHFKNVVCIPNLEVFSSEISKLKIGIKLDVEDIQDTAHEEEEAEGRLEPPEVEVVTMNTDESWIELFGIFEARGLLQGVLTIFSFFDDIPPPTPECEIRSLFARPDIHSFKPPFMEVTETDKSLSDNDEYELE